MAGLWRIDELQAMTAAALASAEQDQAPSGRVRAVPDARTIRYYTTIGLLDRPAEMRGRVAYYGRRHVLQLVCIKRLQAQGLPLVEVQEQLAGATTRRLSNLAALPAGFWDIAPPAPPRERAQRKSFWTDPAAEPAEIPQHPAPRPATYVRLPIAPGVALEIAGLDLRRLTVDQAAGLTPLLEDLSRELNRLGMTRGPGSPPADMPRSSPDSSSSSNGESPCY